MKFIVKAAVFLSLCIAVVWIGNMLSFPQEHLQMYNSLKQLETGNGLHREASKVASQSQVAIQALMYVWLVVLSLLFWWKDLLKMMKKTAVVGMLMCLCLLSAGCWRPFKPVQLEVIESNEFAFLIPYTEAVEQQEATQNEEMLRKGYVNVQQIEMPQQWVPKGYETLAPNGEWKPAAMLLKVDGSPVAREWTAEKDRGTSTRDEAIWVMTSDQVEFSTGWSCTARIATKDDAIKFVSNYRNGTLAGVMDNQIRQLVQTEFALEVTDLPMQTLREQATPHITKVVDKVKEHFKTKGITIENLGISGGFTYRNPTIQEKLVEVFNAEQEKNIAIAKTQAQTETNKRIQLEAEAKAKAILTEREAEAKGIQAVADAKSYEIEKAKADAAMYIQLKQIELAKAKLERWDGKFPVYFMGSGENSPEMLLQVPTVAESK